MLQKQYFSIDIFISSKCLLKPCITNHNLELFDLSPPKWVNNAPKWNILCLLVNLFLLNSRGSRLCMSGHCVHSVYQQIYHFNFFGGWSGLLTGQAKCFMSLVLTVTYRRATWKLQRTRSRTGPSVGIVQ